MRTHGSNPLPLLALVGVAVLLGCGAVLLLLRLGGVISSPASSNATSLAKLKLRHFPGAPSKLEASQPAPALEQGLDSALDWVRVKAHPSDLAPMGMVQQTATVAGNFDSDPDQEVLVYGCPSSMHWLCEADGSRHSVSFPNAQMGGAQALDINGDGVDEVVPNAQGWAMLQNMAGQQPDGGPPPVFDLTGTALGTAPWAGSRDSEPMLRGDFDGRPGYELLRPQGPEPAITDPAGSVLLDINLAHPAASGVQTRVASVTGDINGDGLSDYVYSSGQATGWDDLLGGGAVLGPANEFKLDTITLRHISDLDGDGRGELIATFLPPNYGFYDVARRHWTPFDLPEKQLERRAGAEAEYIQPLGSWVGDFNGDGQREVAILARQMDYLSVGAELECELWLISSTGELYRRERLAEPAWASDSCSFRSGGRDHLALVVRDGAVLISQ